MKKLFFIFSIIFINNYIFSVDNPEAPNHIGEFRKRMKPFEDAATSTTVISEVNQNYYKYEQELDKELNIAYQLLESKLNITNKELLKNSQLQWIKFRDNEFEFIKNNFNPDEHGKDIYYSIGAYRSSLIKNRVEQLLYFLLNY